MIQDGRDEPGCAGRSQGVFDEEANAFRQIPTARALQLPEVGLREGDGPAHQRVRVGAG